MDILKFVSIGLAVGMISGIVGIGGGVLLLPALVWIGGLSRETAAGTTLAVLVVPVVLPAAMAYYLHDRIEFRAAIPVALAFAVGGFAGGWMANNDFFQRQMLQLCFGLIMMYVAFNMIVMSDNEATKAAAGVIATVVAWLVYLGLRLVGKHALEKPKLYEQIQRMDEPGRGDSDYYI